MMDFIGKLSGFVGKNLTYIVFLVVIWAYFMPNAFLWAVPHTVLLLGVIMFGMGMTLHARDFKLIVQRPKEVLIGCTAHYTIMPLLAYALVLAFEMPPEIAVGMILLGSCPSGRRQMSWVSWPRPMYPCPFPLRRVRPCWRRL